MNANVAQCFNFLPVPTDIHFGCGILRDLPDRLRALGAARPFLITDPGVAAAGILDRAAKILQTAQCEFELFDGVKADSGSGLIDDTVVKFKASGCDSVVGIGGGSSDAPAASNDGFYERNRGLRP